MNQFGALFLGLFLIAPLAVPAWGQQVETLWNCKDKDGRTTLTNQKADTAGKDCRIVQQERVTVVPGTPTPKTPATGAAKTPTPAGFPKESASDRAASKARQKETLDRELQQEEQMLAEAKKRLAEQEAVRSGDERNYAKVLERLKPYKDAVEVHGKNVEALKRELANLNR